MSATTPTFADLSEFADQPQALFDRVAQQLASEQRWHELFDLRLMQSRHQLGLPIERGASLEDADPTVRDDLEAGYLSACREVGQLLLDHQLPREAWMYLRPAGEKAMLRHYLESVVPNEESCDTLVELALHEQVDPERGYAWLLAHHGTCNGVTTLDSLGAHLEPADHSDCAAVLLRHVYAELQGNLRGHLHRLQGDAPEGLSIRELIAEYPALTASGSYHLDASHLSSTVRVARVLTDPKLIDLALQLCEYGKTLIEDLQYPGEAPFEEVYPTHEKFFRATLGNEVDAAVEFFTAAAEQELTTEPAMAAPSTTAAETLLVLLDRNQQFDEAMEAYARFALPGRSFSQLPPTLLELARKSGNWARYEQLCQQRNDPVAYAAGRAAQQKQ